MPELDDKTDYVTSFGNVYSRNELDLELCNEKMENRNYNISVDNDTHYYVSRWTG